MAGFAFDEAPVQQSFGFFQGTNKLQSVLNTALGLDGEHIHELEYNTIMAGLVIEQPTTTLGKIAFFFRKKRTLNYEVQVQQHFNQTLEYMLVMERMLEKAKLVATRTAIAEEAHQTAFDKEVKHLKDLCADSFLTATYQNMNFTPYESRGMMRWFARDAVSVDGEGGENTLNAMEARRFKPYQVEGCPIIHYEPQTRDEPPPPIRISAKYTVKHQGNREVSIRILVATIFSCEFRGKDRFVTADGKPRTITIHAKDKKSAELLYLEFKAHSDYFSKRYGKPGLIIKFDDACKKWTDAAKDHATNTEDGDETALAKRTREIENTFSKAKEKFEERLKGEGEPEEQTRHLNEKLGSLTECAAKDIYESIAELPKGQQEGAVATKNAVATALKYVPAAPR